MNVFNKQATTTIPYHYYQMLSTAAVAVAQLPRRPGASSRSVLPGAREGLDAILVSCGGRDCGNSALIFLPSIPALVLGGSLLGLTPSILTL